MIALVILGLGLLIIAAALPVGLEYNRQTADQANGAAAADYAFEIITQGVRLAARDTRDPLFRPRAIDNVLDSDRDGDPTNDPEDLIDLDRDGVPDNDLTFDRYYEPLFKVRNLSMLNIESTPGIAGGPREIADESEDLIKRALPAAFASSQLERDEADFLKNNPALTALVRVYPPILPDNPRTVASFFPVNAGIPSNAGPWGPSTAEVRRATNQRIGWTAFYRRWEYPSPGPDGAIGTRDDILPDPNLYEVIVVVTRRPTTEHHFLLQDSGAASTNWPAPWNFALAGVEANILAVSGRPHRTAPCAWLAWFSSLPTLQPGTDYDAAHPDRPLNLNFNEPSSLTFQCSTRLGELLPVGSVFIPARNDDWPTAANPPGSSGTPSRAAGFVPHAPTALPIYKVISRPDATTVVVENNGFYPWLAAGATPDAWPVWIVPPAARNEGSNKIFETSNPIVTVERRFIRFREAP